MPGRGLHDVGQQRVARRAVGGEHPLGRPDDGDRADRRRRGGGGSGRRPRPPRSAGRRRRTAHPGGGWCAPAGRQRLAVGRPWARCRRQRLPVQACVAAAKASSTSPRAVACSGWRSPPAAAAATRRAGRRGAAARVSRLLRGQPGRHRTSARCCAARPSAQVIARERSRWGSRPSPSVASRSVEQVVPGVVLLGDEPDVAQRAEDAVQRGLGQVQGLGELAEGDGLAAPRRGAAARRRPARRTGWGRARDRCQVVRHRRIDVRRCRMASVATARRPRHR